MLVGMPPVGGFFLKVFHATNIIAYNRLLFQTPIVNIYRLYFS